MIFSGFSLYCKKPKQEFSQVILSPCVRIRRVVNHDKWRRCLLFLKKGTIMHFSDFKILKTSSKLCLSSWLLILPYLDWDPLVDGHEGVLHAHVWDPPHGVHGADICQTWGQNFERSEPVSLTPVASHDTLKLSNPGSVMTGHSKIFVKVSGGSGFNMLVLKLPENKKSKPYIKKISLKWIRCHASIPQSTEYFFHFIGVDITTWEFILLWKWNFLTFNNLQPMQLMISRIKW